MENLKMLNKVINDSQNYAVIYARISSKNENNSINAQIKLGEDVINKNNLLLYDTYIDKISGKTTSPKERKGFSRLLEDAKAGLFKTIVIYRLDRLVRRYDDWIETKKILNKLGIKILFSDTNQALLENSPQSEFFQNFSVMIAEMEPDTISLRASQGRIFRRKSGAYTSPKAPFGYIKQESNDRRKSKSIFIQEPIKLAFIKYIFFLIYRSHDDQTRPRQRRGRGGTGSQSRDSSHFQDSPSPHSSNHTSPSAAPAPAPLAPAAASAPVPPGPPGVMSVAELVQQPGRDHLPYLTPYPHGRGQTW